MRYAIPAAVLAVGAASVLVLATQAHGWRKTRCTPTHGESSIAVQIRPRLKVIQPAHTTVGC